jgi:hypothetical protein
MDAVLRGLRGSECWMYINDLILFSNTAEEHARRIENVRRLDDAIQLHPGKCVFLQPQVQYLGYVLKGEGLSASPDKIKAVQTYPVPEYVRDVRAFLDLASSYRRLMQNFAEKSRTLTQPTRKNQEFHWGPYQQVAFQSLKDKLGSAPVLAYPDFKQACILTTDASKTDIAAILSQVQGGIERPIEYASRLLNTPERSYTAFGLEMLALVWATGYF